VPTRESPLFAHILAAGGEASATRSARKMRNLVVQRSRLVTLPSSRNRGALSSSVGNFQAIVDEARKAPSTVAAATADPRPTVQKRIPGGMDSRDAS
jgi:hypothetical protein